MFNFPLPPLTTSILLPPQIAYPSSVLTFIKHLQDCGDPILREVDRVDGPEEQWVIGRETRRNIASMLGTSYFVDQDYPGVPLVGAILRENVHRSIHLLKCVRVPPVGEDMLGFDKSFRQSTLGRRLSDAYHKSTVKSLVDSSDRTTAATVNCTLRAAGYGKVVFSGMSNSLRLKSEEYIEMLRRKLALPLCVAKGPCARCLCGMEFRNFLDLDEGVRSAAETLLTGHAGVCPQVAGGLFVGRHDSIKRALAQVHRDIQSNIHIAVEERIPGLGENARMDLMISNQSGRQITPIDVGFVSASLSATVAASANNPDAAASLREREKVNYINGSQLHTEVKKRFVPFIISNTGRVGIAADKYLTELFQLNRIPHVFDAKLSRIRKNFIGFIGTVTERYNARFRIALQSSITFF